MDHWSIRDTIFQCDIVPMTTGTWERRRWWRWRDLIALIRIHRQLPWQFPPMDNSKNRFLKWVAQRRWITMIKKFSKWWRTPWKLAHKWKSITRSSSLFSIYIIQRTVNPQSNYKTPIHPRRTWSNEIGYKNLDNNNIKQNSHETQQCNQIWSQPHR